jgi:hypothetical protein
MFEQEFRECLINPNGSVDYDFRSNESTNLLVSQDKSYFILNNIKYPLSYVRTVKFGIPNVFATNSDDKIVGRDVSIHEIYRNSFNDFILIYYYDKKKYRFDRIKYANKDYMIKK